MTGLKFFNENANLIKTPYFLAENGTELVVIDAPKITVALKQQLEQFKNCKRVFILVSNSFLSKILDLPEFIKLVNSEFPKVEVSIFIPALTVFDCFKSLLESEDCKYFNIVEESELKEKSWFIRDIMAYPEDGRSFGYQVNAYGTTCIYTGYTSRLYAFDAFIEPNSNFYVPATISNYYELNVFDALPFLLAKSMTNVTITILALSTKEKEIMTEIVKNYDFNVV